MKLILSVIIINLFSLGMLNAADPCVVDVDFNDWKMEGNLSHGAWDVAADGKSVEQLMDSKPTFFVGDEELINVRIKGEFIVNDDEDDDFIGFVFGYKAPNDSSADNYFETWLFTWKKDYGNAFGYNAQLGFSLIRAEGSVANTDDAFYKYFWEQPDIGGFDRVAKRWGEYAWGWEPYKVHKFELLYTTTRIIIYIDGVEIFGDDSENPKLSGCFEQGRFGFYNFSQPNVEYRNFTYELAAEFIAIPDVACQKDVVTFKSTCSKVPEKIVSWEWDFDDGSTSTEINPTHSFTDAGVYNVQLVITDDRGCTDTIIRPVVINPVPNTEITGPVNACENNVSVYTCENNGDYDYEWEVTGGTVQGGKKGSTLNVNWGEPGTGTLSLTIINEVTSCYSHNKINIKIEEAPTVTVTRNHYVCPNDPYTFDIEVSGGMGEQKDFTYLWDPVDGIEDPTVLNATINLSEPGAVVYTVTAFDTAGCPGTATIVMNVRKGVDATFDPDSIAFGNLLGCTEYIDTTILVKNPANESAYVLAVEPDSVFSIQNTLPFEIEQRDSALLTIRFNPENEIDYNDTIRIIFDPCSDTLFIPFTGIKNGISLNIPDTIDLGEVIYCSNQKTSTVNFELTNTSGGDYDLSVEAVNINGPFDTDITTGQNLLNGVANSQSVRFLPGNTTPNGEVTGSIELDIQPCDIKKIIYLTGFKANVSLEYQAVNDFGMVDYLSQPTLDIIFVNNGTVQATLSSCQLLDQTVFSIIDIQPAPPLTLEIGDTIVVTVQYTPRVGKDSTYLQMITDDPCDVVFEALITGESDLDPGTAVLSLGRIDSKTGNKIIMPLTISEAENILENGVNGYEIQIRFNRSMLSPTGNTVMSSIDDDYIYVDITGEIDGEEDLSGSLFDFEFITTLGNDSCTYVDINEINWLGGMVTVTDTVHGRVCLNDICNKAGQSRFYFETGKFGIKAAYPNPASDMIRIEYETEEDGFCIIQLVDSYGNIIEEFNPDNSKSGLHSKELDVSGTTPGAYMLILKTTTQSEAAKINIIR